MREGQILNLPLREWENERPASNIQHRIMNERQERISNSQHSISNIHIQGKRERMGNMGIMGAMSRVFPSCDTSTVKRRSH